MRQAQEVARKRLVRERFQAARQRPARRGNAWQREEADLLALDSDQARVAEQRRLGLDARLASAESTWMSAAPATAGRRSGC